MAKSSSVKVAAFIFIIFASQVAMAYQNGSSPWCMVDDMGNASCIYVSRSACLDSRSSDDETCVLNQQRPQDNNYGLNPSLQVSALGGGIDPRTGRPIERGN